MDKCDLIMKGGITSGVVYPKAVSELSRKYQFENIGGTSAGAIAAGFTAAAEYNRKVTDTNSGFKVLDEMPEVLSEALFSLFEPHPKHRKAFKFLLKILKKKGVGLFLYLVWSVRLVNNTLKRLPNTFYGLCTGLSKDKSENLALTDWMNLWLEKTAGRIQENSELPVMPLTFGMLRDKGIKLRTITTNLSQRTPINLPKIGFSLVKKKDLESLLPENIIDYIESIQDNIKTDVEVDDRDDYWVLPSGDDMPVLLAMRLSLSFPILLSAFPIYRVDYSLRLCPSEKRKPKLCWLSDGGITSNFPIHLFDSVFPSKPTFGVSLGEFSDCRQYGDDSSIQPFPENRTYLPQGAGRGLSVQAHEITGPFAFLMSIFNAAQTWQDTNQTYLSGYRERVVRISLKKEEGGMNLHMPPELIESLTLVGKQAGTVLRDEFQLDEHRWRRALSAYSAMESALSEIEDQYMKSSPESTHAFMKRCSQSVSQGAPLMNSYKPENVEEVEELMSRFNDLMSLARQWKTSPIRKTWGEGNQGMPRPSAGLKITPEKFLD